MTDLAEEEQRHSGRLVQAVSGWYYVECTGPGCHWHSRREVLPEDAWSHYRYHVHREAAARAMRREIGTEPR